MGGGEAREGEGEGVVKGDHTSCVVSNQVNHQMSFIADIRLFNAEGGRKGSARPALRRGWEEPWAG